MIKKILLGSYVAGAVASISAGTAFTGLGALETAVGFSAGYLIGGLN